MDDLLFAFKRAHLAGNRFALKVLAKYGLTPARFDLMRLIYARRDFSIGQSYLRARLGIARSTLCRMLRALQRLGWIERKVSPFDRRTRWCTLTYAGRARVWSILDEVVRARVVADVLDRALRLDHGVTDVGVERKAADWLCTRVVWVLATPRDSIHLSLAA